MQPEGASGGRAGGRPLSVSSVGSEAMQPFSSQTATTFTRTFSILGRIGGDATFFIPAVLGG